MAATALGVGPAFAAEIHDALRDRDAAAVRRILDADRSQARVAMPGGIVPLHLAATAKDAALVELLLRLGAEVDARSRAGYTPLHLAAAANGHAAAAALIRAGADVTARTGQGLTPLRLAVTRGATDVAPLLIGTADASYSTLLSDPDALTGGPGVERRELEQAFAMFLDLLRHDPGNEAINFAVGLTAYSLQRHGQAALAFERILDRDPANRRARLELARTQMAREQYDLARAEFEAVLAATDEPEVRANIQAYLERIRRGRRRWRGHFRAEVGAFYDSNVNVGPDDDVIDITPLVFGSLVVDTLAVDATSQPAESAGVLASVLFAVAYDLGRKDRWQWLTDALGYQTWLDKSPDDETGYVRLRSGPQFHSTIMRLAVPLKLVHIRRGDEGLVSIVGLSPSYTRVVGPESLWSVATRAEAEYRDYDDLDDRDGPYVALTETVRRFFGPNRGHVSVSAGLFGELADAPEQENRGYDVALGASVAVRNELTLYGKLRYKESEYEAKSPLEFVARRDKQKQAAIGATTRVGQSWGVDLNFTATDNDSSFGLFEYERKLTTCTLFYEF